MSVCVHVHDRIGNIAVHATTHSDIPHADEEGEKCSDDLCSYGAYNDCSIPNGSSNLPVHDSGRRFRRIPCCKYPYIDF